MGIHGNQNLPRPAPSEVVARYQMDWADFARDVQERWERPIDLKKWCGLSQSTTMAAWHGRPLGVIPFMKICFAMYGANPLQYFRIPRGGINGQERI